MPSIRHPSYDFVSPPPGEFVCNICADVLFDPVEIPQCEHLYCRDCITDWLKDNSKCPQCQVFAEPSSLKQANRQLRNFLDGLKVRCTTDGCRTIVKANELDSHLKECTKSDRQFCQRGCDQLINLSDTAEHNCLETLKACLIAEVEKNRELENVHLHLRRKQEVIQRLQAEIVNQRRATWSTGKRSASEQLVPFGQAKRYKPSHHHAPNTYADAEKRLWSQQRAGAHTRSAFTTRKRRDPMIPHSTGTAGPVRPSEYIRNSNETPTCRKEFKQHSVKAVENSLAHANNRKENESSGELPNDSSSGKRSPTEASELLAGGSPRTVVGDGALGTQGSGPNTSRAGAFNFKCSVRQPSESDIVKSDPVINSGLAFQIKIHKCRGHLDIFLLCHPMIRGNEVAWKLSYKLSILRERWPHSRSFVQHGQIFRPSDFEHGFSECCRCKKFSSPEMEVLNIEVVVFAFELLTALPSVVQSPPGTEVYLFTGIEHMFENDRIYSPLLECFRRQWKLLLKRVSKGIHIAALSQCSVAENAWLITSRITFRLQFRDRSSGQREVVRTIYYKDGDTHLGNIFLEHSTFGCSSLQDSLEVEVRID